MHFFFIRYVGKADILYFPKTAWYIKVGDILYLDGESLKRETCDASIIFNQLIYFNSTG